MTIFHPLRKLLELCVLSLASSLPNLVCSKESLTESWWVDRELDRVLNKERELFKEREERINLLIPITIDDFVFSWNGAKAEEIRRYAIGDFKEWEDKEKFEKALNELIHALND